MKRYLSMLLFDRKNLCFRDFVRLQQLEAQLGALAFDGVGDERLKLELTHQYNALPLVCPTVPPSAPLLFWSVLPGTLRRLRAHPANTSRPALLPNSVRGARPHGFPRRALG